MIRLVIDTNILVSALLKPRGNEAAILRIVLAGGATLCLSSPILNEYRTVMARPKFRFNASLVASLLDQIAAIAMMVEPKHRITSSPDDSDNRFLECCEAAGADYLITGNTRHFPRKSQGTSIITARQLLESILPH